MPNQKRSRKTLSGRIIKILLGLMPVMPGRSFIRGRKEPTFAPALDIKLRQMTFRKCEAAIDAGLGVLEEAYAKLVSALIREGKEMAVLVPRHVRDLGERELFWWGWTLIEHAGEVLSFQRVVFPQAAAVEHGGCDEGAIYRLPRPLLSAWNGRTKAQNAAQAA